MVARAAQHGRAGPGQGSLWGGVRSPALLDVRVVGGGCAAGWPCVSHAGTCPAAGCRGPPGSGLSGVLGRWLRSGGLVAGGSVFVAVCSRVPRAAGACRARQYPSLAGPRSLWCITVMFSQAVAPLHALACRRPGGGGGGSEARYRQTRLPLPSRPTATRCPGPSAPAPPHSNASRDIRNFFRPSSDLLSPPLDPFSPLPLPEPPPSPTG